MQIVYFKSEAGGGIDSGEVLYVQDGRLYYTVGSAEVGTPLNVDLQREGMRIDCPVWAAEYEEQEKVRGYREKLRLLASKGNYIEHYDSIMDLKLSETS